jgi:hypothetical protein
MANSLSKGTLIAYDEVIEGFDAECVMSREVMTRTTDQQSMQRAGDVEYVSQEMYANVVTGLDLTSASKSDVIDRKVPIVYRTPSNVIYELDALQLRDPSYMREMGKAARKALSADIDTALANNVATNGGIVIAKTGDYSWDMAAEAEVGLIVRGVTAGMDRKHFLNAFDAQKVSKDLGNRAYIGDLSKGAYERSQLPPISNFRTFRTDNLVNSTVTGTVTSTLVNGANQKLTVAAMTGGGLIQDNRTMTLNCDGANVANVKIGDTFTLPTVFAVHQVTKASTGVLQTFRVLANAAGALTITPAIVVDGPYQNVTNSPADNAALTFVNTATKPINPFWSQDACVLSFGRLAVEAGNGAGVTRATTKQGAEIVVIEQFNATTMKTLVRFTTLYGTSVLQPDKCGFVVANQV